MWYSLYCDVRIKKALPLTDTMDKILMTQLISDCCELRTANFMLPQSSKKIGTADLSLSVPVFLTICICSAPSVFQYELTACRHIHTEILKAAKAQSASGQPHRGFAQQIRDGC